MHEIWRDIVGYEGLYQVSNFGNIKSLSKKWTGNNGSSRSHDDIILKPFPTPKGYLKVKLAKSGIQKNFSVHRLVMTMFIANDNNLPEINHKNGIKSDNNLKNLEWISTSDNQLHSIHSLGRIFKRGSDHFRAVKAVQRSMKGNVIKIYGSITDASNELGINRPNIVSCLTGKRRSAGGYLWTLK